MHCISNSHLGHQLLAGTDVSQEEEQETLCTCGNLSNLYVQCDICSLWYHAPCVNYVKAKCEDFICIKCLYNKVKSIEILNFTLFLCIAN